MKLSIAIPVYNTPREYLDECLTSICASTLDDYEIVMVDDGSTESCRDLAEKYGARYYRTENHGILAARIYAVSLCLGDYVAFCDSDDSVSFNYHRPMVDDAIRTGADIVMNDWAFHTERCRRVCTGDSTIKDDIDVGAPDITEKFLSQEGREHSYYVLWNKIYRREVIAKAIERVAALSWVRDSDRRVSFGEDALINFFAWTGARRVRNLHTGYYFYRITPNQTVAVTSENKLRYQIGCMAAVLDTMEEVARTLPMSERLLIHIDSWRALMSRTHYSYAKKMHATVLYPYIKDAYRVTELRKSTYRDGAAYAGARTLPTNFSERERALRAVYEAEGDSVRVRYRRNDRYAEKTLSLIKEEREIKIIRSKNADLIIPHPHFSLKNRILLNPFVYRLGMLLFPKGSKIRAMLKRKV